MRKILLKLIRLYQYTAFLRKPFLRTIFLTDRICRFEPTCSSYAYQAVDKYGAIKGLWLGFKRIVRCHPWANGGVDPVV